MKKKIASVILLVLIVFSTLSAYQINKAATGKTSESAKTPNSPSTSSTPPTSIQEVADPPLYVENIGTPQWELANSLCASSSNDLYIAGDLYYWDNTVTDWDFDFLLTRLNSAGGFISAKTISTNGTDTCNDVINYVSTSTPPEFGVIVTGESSTYRESIGWPYHGYGDLLIARFDYNLNLMWGKVIYDPTSKGSLGSSLTETYDGNFVVTGPIWNPTNMPGEHVLVAKFNSNTGALIWATVLWGPGDDCSFSVIESASASHDIVVTGYTTGFDGSMDILLARFTQNGVLIWANAYGSPDWKDDVGLSVVEDNTVTPGSLIVTGWTKSGLGAGGEDVLLAKFYPDGARYDNGIVGVYGGTQDDEGHSLVLDPTGNIVVTGLTEISNPPIHLGQEEFLAKFNYAGNSWPPPIIWEREVGGPKNDGGFKGINYVGGFATAGFTYSPLTFGHSDILLATFDSNGYTSTYNYGCEVNITFTSNYVNFTRNFNYYNFSLPVLNMTISFTNITLGVMAFCHCIYNVNTGLSYSTIQAAIDAPETLDGHTIFCGPGNYTENVKVYKSLNITGGGPSVCQIIPFEPDDTIYINVSNVIIENFTVQSVTGYSAVRLDKANDCSISSNTITGNSSGITLSGSRLITVSNNLILSQRGNAIMLTDSSQRNTIVGNSLNLNHYGIVLFNASSLNVIGDNFVNSSDWSGIRLNWQGSNYAPVMLNNITNNVVTNNGGEGIFLDTPSPYNLLEDNYLSDDHIGIRLRTNSSIVIHNTIISNSYRGISAESSYSNNVYDNFLNNTNNAWDNGANSWNVAQQTGPNIIGGPCIGGNYWSDNPNTTDTNGDGLGDVAYNITGGANKDNLPLVTKQGLFIASFMTPEGEPYPFDDLTISNGTWRTEFTSATHVVTEVPTNATYIGITEIQTEEGYYPWGIWPSNATYVTIIEAEQAGVWKEKIGYCQLSILPREAREFYFYALNWTITFEPDVDVVFAERGANLITSSTHSPGNMTLNVDVSMTNNTYACIAVPLQMLNSQNQRIQLALAAEYMNGQPINNAGGEKVMIIERIKQETVDRWRGCLVEGTGQKTRFSFVFAEVDPSLGTIAVGDALWNDSIWPNPVQTTLETLNGTLYPQEYLMPQYAVPPGNYLLNVTGCPATIYAVARTGSGTYAATLEVHVHLPAELNPWTFYVAVEDPLADSSYSNLVYNTANKTITVNVGTETPYDWWGCFVLPDGQTVKTLTAYSGSASYQLQELYNYTEENVGGYNIVAVRIPPEIDRLSLEYIQMNGGCGRMPYCD